MLTIFSLAQLNTYHYHIYYNIILLTHTLGQYGSVQNRTEVEKYYELFIRNINSPKVVV